MYLSGPKTFHQFQVFHEFQGFCKWSTILDGAGSHVHKTFTGLLQLGELQETLLSENAFYESSKTKLITKKEVKGCAILVFHIQLLPLFKNIHAVHIYFLFVASYQKVAVLRYI